MNSSLLDTVINQLIGVVIGTISSIAISWYFYKKADLPAKAAGAQLESLLFLFIQQRLGDDLAFNYSPGKSELPKNRDFPHITGFWFSMNEVQQGESVWILFRVVDLGLDHEPRLMEITEMSSMLNFSANRQGYGYYVCKITFPKNALPGQHKINFKLFDRKNNIHVQALKISVKEK